MSRLISFVMHPLFMMFYVMIILILVRPFDFGVNQITDKRAMILMIGVFTSSVMIPGFGIMLLKPLGFMESYQTPTQKERIGPYIILSIMYVWVYKSLTAGLGFPQIYAQVFLGATISLFVAFFLNNFIKVSAHMNGVGGLVAAILIVLVTYAPGGLITIPFLGKYISMSLSLIFIICVILAGATAYARLALKAHTYQELWLGFLVGVVGQIAAMLYLR